MAPARTVRTGIEAGGADGPALHFYAASVALSITKRYLTSPLSMRS